MINWILGGIILGLTALIIYRVINKMRKGESCCCEGCTENECHCLKS